MIIFPAIDLKAGQVVRLAEGDMDRATIYGDDPAHQARLFAQAGAKPHRLGRSVLRTSTAGTAAAAVLLARTGRWS